MKCQAQETIETEQALAAFGKYKGKCTKCGKLRHKGSKCRGSTDKKSSDDKSQNTNKKDGNGREKKKNRRRRGFNKSKVTCYNCNKKGHFKHECPELKEDKKEKDTVLMAVQTRAQIMSKTWIADLGGSTHIMNDLQGLYDIEEIEELVKIGDGNIIYTTKIGKLKVLTVLKNGHNMMFVLEKVQYIPGFWVKLFSLTAAMSKECIVTNIGRAIVIKKDEVTLEFDHEIKMMNGFVCRIKLEVIKADNALIMVQDGRKVNINDLHKALGHISEENV